MLSAKERLNPLHLLAAFGSGGLLTMMVFLNGEAGRHGGALFSSWLAHCTGTVAAFIFLAVLRRRRTTVDGARSKAPLWAYLGGVSGAATVMLTSTAVNTPLALAGTLALGLAGQVVFSLAADQWGLFGLPKRRLGLRDAGAVALIASGSVLIILFGLGEFGMTLYIAYAIMAGVLVGLSRQLNGRLALSTSPLLASFFNHAIGFIVLTCLGLVLGNLLLPGASDTPWWAYFGGPVGVIFVASGSWLIARIGAVNTALLVIGGQMVSGVVLDLIRSAPLTLWASALGVVLILGGMMLTQKR